MLKRAMGRSFFRIDKVGHGFVVTVGIVPFFLVYVFVPAALLE